MAAFTITTSQNIDELTGKTGGDTYAINGGTLTFDQDSRYGLNQTTSTSLAGITISATLGGTVEIDARYIRLITFNTGTGNVPAYNTTISIGGFSGKLIGVYSALNAAPTAVGAAMPASGYIKIKQWNSVACSAGALTGIGANSTGVCVPGFIELVGDEAATITATRLGLFRMRGEWYNFLGTTTSGTNTTTYQIPNNGAITYIPGVWVETGTSTNEYEFYPCAGSLTATAANMATDDRGKVCWISTAGLLRFQHDGTNSTGGFLPPSGRKLRIPNIITTNCTTAARTVNALPNSTLATRYDFTATGGVISIDKANLSWYPSFAQSYSITLSNVAIFEQLSVSELASPAIWTNVGVGQCAAQSQTSLLMSLNFAGGTISGCTWSRAALGTAVFVNSYTDINGFNFTNDKSFSFVARGNAGAGNSTLIRAVNCSWTNSIFGIGQIVLTTCTNLTFTNSRYWDHPATTTIATNPMYMFSLLTNCNNIIVNGVNFGSLALMQPYSGILSIGAAGCSNIKLRNLGTYAQPLDLGGAIVTNATYTQTTTVITATSTNHGLKVGDIIYVYWLTLVGGTFSVGSKTIASVANANTFTITVTTGTEATPRAFSYYPTMSAVLVALAANAAANTVKIQRCYTPHTRTGIFSGDNSSKNVLYENIMGDYINAPVTSELNASIKGIHAVHAMTAQTNPVYGSHWFDIFTGNITPNLSAQAWTSSTTTATVTSTAHGLRTGEQILVTVSSNIAVIVLGVKTVTVTGANTFTFTCISATSSGTITYENLNSRIGLLMNEATSDTVNQYVKDSGNPNFTAAGGLYMPVINDQITFEMPELRLGHISFPIAEPIMAGGTLSNYNIFYSINTGVTYGNYFNLYYQRSGGNGVSTQFTFTVTDATGVTIGDYAWGTGVGLNSIVTNVSGNTITVDKANTATVSGIIRFNHLPSEPTIPSTGFKMKLRFKTFATNASAITSLYFFTKNTNVSRSYQYPLDTYILTISNIISGSDIVVYQSGTENVRSYVDNLSETSSDYTYSTIENIDLGIFKSGYIPYYIRNYSLTSTNASVPVAQVIDRAYLL